MAIGRRVGWMSALAVVALLAVAAGLVWFFGGSEPAAVDLEAAGDEVASDEDGDEAQATDDVDVDGTWRVDTEAVPFDGATGDGTFVGYRVDEELSGIGAATAVGRTPAVEGQVRVEGAAVTAAELEADLTQLESDESRRDGRVRSTFAADGIARFSLTDPIEEVAIPSGDSVHETTATGELTIEGVTREIQVTLQSAQADGRVVLAGSAPIALSDFEVEPPTAPMVLGVSDDAVIEWQLYLVPDDG